MNNPNRKLSLLMFVGLLAFGLSACNTMRGLGKDTEEAGEKIQEEAEEHGGDDRVEQR